MYLNQIPARFLILSVVFTVVFGSGSRFILARLTMCS